MEPWRESFSAHAHFDFGAGCCCCCCCLPVATFPLLSDTALSSMCRTWHEERLRFHWIKNHVLIWLSLLILTSMFLRGVVRRNIFRISFTVELSWCWSWCCWWRWAGLSTFHSNTRFGAGSKTYLRSRDFHMSWKFRDKRTQVPSPGITVLRQNVRAMIRATVFASPWLDMCDLPASWQHTQRIKRHRLSRLSRFKSL